MPTLVVFRSLIVPTVRAVHWQNIGACWADRESAAYPYAAGGLRGVEVRLRGIVSRDDINVVETQHAQEDWPEGHEVNLKRGAVVKITEVTVGRLRGHLTPVRLARPFYARVSPTADCDCWRPT